MKEEMKFPISPRRFSRLVVASPFLAAAMAFVANNSLAQGPFLTYSASAYGTFANVGGTVVAGKTAPVSIGGGCGTAKVPQTVLGTVLSLNVPPIVVTGVVNTSAADALNSATGTSDVHSISLLGTLITATEVKAVSTTSKDNTGFHVSAAGSSLVNLIIAGGLPINVVPFPNTTIQLAGFGKVVLNEQIVTGTSSAKGLTVNMIHVYVTNPKNVLGIRVGTQIIVADAHSGLSQINGPASLDGTAFGTKVSSTIIKSSATAPVSVGCNGNSLKTATLLGINVLNVLSTGTIHDTAQGTVTLTPTPLSSSQTTADIQTANLLTGVIQASVIHAQANASTTDGMTFTFSTAASSFATLSVSGHPEITANVAANTKVTLVGIGTLYLKRVIQTKNSIEVRMIEVVLASGNILGLPTGLDVIVGDASASLHSPTHP
jgi:hypothetical protein